MVELIALALGFCFVMSALAVALCAIVAIEAEQPTPPGDWIKVDIRPEQMPRGVSYDSLDTRPISFRHLDLKVCPGCKYYYGKSDLGRRINCAVHPYGPETETCSDWESDA